MAVRFASFVAALIALIALITAPSPAIAGKADRAALSRALDAAMAAPETARTQAIVVLHEGRIVGERYAPGHDARTRFLSASIAKMMMGAAAGVLVGDGRLQLDRPAPVATWRADGDPRGAITLRHLLGMRSGLAWDENPASATSDTIAMLVGRGRLDMADYAADRPLAHPPGVHYAYSSGDTLIVSGLIRDVAGGSLAAYQRLLSRRLFDPLGMNGTVVNYDAAGAWQASTYAWAPARDFARFGQLLLQEGRWRGRRILPRGWVAGMRSYPLAASEAEDVGFWKRYGLTTGFTPADADDPLAGTFGHDGFGGQLLLVDPRRNVVLVRFGRLDRDDDRAFAAQRDQTAAILAAFPVRKQ